MKRPKVAVVALSRNTGPTGVCRFAANLCASLQYFADPILILGAWQREYFERCYSLPSASVAVHCVDIANSSLSRNRWYRTGLNSLAKSLGATFIHAAFPMPLDRRSSPCKIVGTVHDLYPFDVPENFGRANAFLNRAAFRIFLNNVDALTCVSMSTLDRLYRLFPARAEALKPLAIYNAVATQVDAKPPTWFNADRPFFLAVAQHRKNKNLLRLLTAFSTVRTLQDKSPALYVVGQPGPETEALTQTALKDSVQFHSQLTEAELEFLYQNCLALVCPSLFEGFCLPVIEAARSGAPLIVSEIPIFREVVPFAERFVDPQSVDSIKCALQDLAGGSNRTPRALDQFQPKSLARLYRQVYEGVMPAEVSRERADDATTSFSIL